MTFGMFLVCLGAVARISRFVVYDYLFESPRAWISRRFGDASWPSTLVGCDWCTSIWASALVFALAWISGGAAWFVYPCLALTASYVYSAATGWIED